MKPKENSRITSPSVLVCLGPPRSGLNALSDCLRRMGFSTQNCQRDANTINLLLFQELGLSPLSAGFMPDGWKQSTAAAKAEERIINMVSCIKRTAVLADHLLCRTLPLWYRAFKKAGIKAIYLFMIRHPWETAQSLAASETLDINDAHVLWLSHIRSALHNLADRKHTLLTFDQLLADPVTAMDSLLLIPELSFDLRSSLLEIIQPCMKHHHAGNISKIDEDFFGPYARLYDQLRLIQSKQKFAGNLSDEKESSVLPTTSKENRIFKSIFSVEFGVIDSLLHTIGRYESQQKLRSSQTKESLNSPDSFFAKVIFPSSRQGGQIVETIPLIDGEWQKIFLTVPEPELIKRKPIILIPLDRPGTIKISHVELLNKATNEIIWYSNKNNCFCCLVIDGRIIRLPDRYQLLLYILEQNAQIKIFPDHHKVYLPMMIGIWLKASLKNETIFQNYGKDLNRSVSNASIINDSLMQSLKNITSLGNFHQQIKVRTDEFKKISTIDEGSLIKAKTFWGATIYLLPQNEIVSLKIYSYGLFEPELCSFFIDYLFEGAVTIDIGSHIGFFSMLAAELVGEMGKIYSFEPTPSTRLVLKKNLEPYKQTSIIPKLAWFEKTTIDFHDFGIQFSAYNTAVSDRLLPEQKRIAIDNLIQVEAVTLDGFCSEQNIQPHLIKIDAESSEMQVLQGMVNLLDQMRPVLTIEVGDMDSTIKNGVPRSHELLEFIMNYDYLPLSMVGGRYELHEVKDKYVYDNIIMVPTEKIPARRPLGAVAVQRGRFY